VDGVNNNRGRRGEQREYRKAEVAFHDGRLGQRVRKQME
jgi:hypothetical protein